MLLADLLQTTRKLEGIGEVSLERLAMDSERMSDDIDGQRTPP